MSDALTQLRSALAPKQGMRRIPLTLESYQHQSAALSSKLLLNMMVEQQPADARNQVALIPTPGLSLLVNVGTGPIHAMANDLPGRIYVVSGTHFYLVAYNPVTDVWSATDLGDIGTPSGGTVLDQRLYSIAVGVTAVVVCSPPNAYVSVNGGPVALITTTWPSYGASSVAYLDGYFVFTAQDEPSQFFISDLLDPTAVDALDFASLDAFPNAVVKVMSLAGSLWFGGYSGWEVWWNAGNLDFPFRRRMEVILQRSLGAARSVAKGDESIFWWSSDNCVYRTAGYQEQRISTHAIEHQLENADIVSAYTHMQRGHTFYTINMADRSLVYDTLTKVWHNVSSYGDGAGPLRGSCAATMNEGSSHIFSGMAGKPIIGDNVTGRLMVMDSDLSTDMGGAVRRQVVLPPLYAGTRRAFCSRLEVEMEVGTMDTFPEVLLEWSDDGGVTFTGGPRAMSTGGLGEGRKRVFTTRLGSFRNRVFRLTAQHAMTVYAVDCDIVEGNH